MKQNNAIPGLTSEDMQKLALAFEVETELTEVILYGSRAKESHRPGSDGPLYAGSKLDSKIHRLTLLRNLFPTATRSCGFKSTLL